MLEENYSNDADRDLKIIPLETKLSILSKENHFASSASSSPLIDDFCSSKIFSGI